MHMAVIAEKKAMRHFVCLLILLSNSLLSASLVDTTLGALHSGLAKVTDVFKQKKFTVSLKPDRATLTSAQRQAQMRLMYQMLGNMEGSKDLSLIVQRNEWNELHIDWLLDQLDRAQTDFGRWGLRELSYPHAQKDRILFNQKMIKVLLDDEKLYKALIGSLKEIYNREHAIVAYFQEDNALTHRVKSMYFNFFLIPKSIRTKLNKSINSLEIATWLQMVKSSWALAAFVGAKGLWREFEWAMAPGNPHPEFNLTRAIKDGLSEIYFQNSFSERIPFEGNAYSMYRVFMHGSLGDRYRACVRGFSTSTPIILPVIGEVYNMKSDAADPSKVSFWWKAGSGLVAVTPTVFYDVLFAQAFYSSYSTLRDAHTTMKDLRERCVQVRDCIKHMQNIARLLKGKTEYASTKFARILARVLDGGVSADFEKLMALFDTDTFDGKDTFFYSRGRVLAVHSLLRAIKNDLVEILRALGQLDAYVSLATLMKDQSCPGFSFAQFIDAQQPSLELKGLWVPVLKGAHVVTNDFVLGGSKNTKAVITGPNGGGKSTILKAVGQSIFMAQSWGIVPARSAQMTVCECLRTCLHQEEDLQKGISTFMAENGRMQEIQDTLEKCNELHKKSVALIDEPYRGTVDAESVVRINAFGQRALSWNSAAVMVATHVYPETVMNSFDGYHVVINEPSIGVFERTFKIADGIAQWWFNDGSRRSRFIDWLGKTHTQNQQAVSQTI